MAAANVQMYLPTNPNRIAISIEIGKTLSMHTRRRIGQQMQANQYTVNSQQFRASCEGEEEM